MPTTRDPWARAIAPTNVAAMAHIRPAEWAEGRADRARAGLEPVSTAMITELQTLDVKSPIEDLLPVFEHGRVAIVMDGDKFLGLITRIDLLNYLRRRVA